MFALFYGYQPLRTARNRKAERNPWRSGNESLRPKFHVHETEMIAKLKDSRTGVGNLLLRMLEHEYSLYNKGTRILAGNAMKHAVFQPLFAKKEDSNLEKRSRLITL